MISKEDMEATRVIADEIARYRQDSIDRMYKAIVKECDDVVESEYDLARGNGRGPWWAAGD